MTQYVALLRGINVGGRNLIRMSALRDCFVEQGLHEVATYIQSGNVIFRSSETRSAALVRRIEQALSGAFGYRASVVLRNRRQLERTIAGAPPGFGSLPARFRYDVIFLKEPLRAAQAISGVPVMEGVDQATAGSGVLYFSRLIAKASQSKLARLVSLPIYQEMTIRNWNTTTTLLRLMKATGG